MPASVQALLTRLIHAGLRRRGEAASFQDARRIQSLLRFAGLFVVTVLLPALLLAYFALASIRSEELALDADLRGRAAGIEGQVQQELTAVFQRFEQLTTQRVDGGGSPLDRLAELSPFLRVAFRLDANGQLAAPFVAPEPRPPGTETAAFRRPWQRGVRAELDGDWSSAAEAFGEAARVDHPSLRAEAAFARARNLIRSGRSPATVLADVYSDHASERDRQGFRIGDLVVLEQARMRVRDDPETAATALQELITELLNRRWALGTASPIASAGEPAITRAALDALPPGTDADWMARSRNRLNERIDQLRWAEAVYGELDLLASSQAVEGRFTYFAGPSSNTLWAVTRLSGNPTLFAFELDALLAHLAETAARSTAADAELRADLIATGESTVQGAIVQRALGPWVSHVTLVVRHQSPELLERQKGNRRLTRLIVVVLSVFLVFVGVIFAARFVGRELENARMKADFAANVSHELRSPITQIRLKGESLQFDLCTDDDDRREHYDAIVRESERLSRLVDNVLDFASIERGAKRYQLRRDDLGAVVRAQCEAGRSAFTSLGVELAIDVPADLPPVWLDRDAIGQVLTNLLSNAAKYGAEGRWVGVSARATAGGVEVSVSDRGIGITAEELPKIFDDFFRSTDPRVRRNKGTGIGLSIVRYIVEAHGGTISAESEPGGGTTFTVTLPLDPPEGAGGALSHAAHPVR